MKSRHHPAAWSRLTGPTRGPFIAARNDATGEAFQLRWHLTARGESRTENFGVARQGLESKPLKFEENRRYELRTELNGAQIKCFLDGQLRHTITVEQPLVPRFFATSGWDTQRHQIVIKLVHARDTPVTAHLRIDGMKSLASTAEMITLSATGPANENSFDQPTKIVPINSKEEGFGPQYDSPMKPWSIVILRADGERE